MSVIYVGKRMSSGYTRDKKLSLQEWAEKKVIFTSEDVSPILGNFKTKYSPQYVKLMQLAERTLTRGIFAKWSSQAGKSLFAILVASHKLDQNPATIIYGQPIKDDVPKVLTLKINPVLKSIPDLWKKFEDYSNQERFRTKDAIKRVAGGALVVSGSSVKERKSLTSPMVILDEVGEMETGTVDEFSERTKSFSRFHPLVIGVSTIVHPKDEICINHDSSEIKIEWHFICRECKNNFYPAESTLKIKTKSEYAQEHSVKEEDIKLSKYIAEVKKTVHLQCPHCLSKIDEEERTDMILNNSVDWFEKLDDNNYKLFEIDSLTTESTFGIDMNSLGSYFAPLQDIALQWVKANYSENKEDALDKFKRGWLNTFHKSDLDKTISSTDLGLLNSEYDEFVVPDDTASIYLGIDTQKGYYWVTLVAFRYGMSPHLMWASRVEDEQTIEELMDRDFYYKDGRVFSKGIKRAGQDWQGYRESKEVFNEETGEITQETVMDMPQRVKEFAYRMSEKYGADNDGRERFYATRGEEFLTNDEFYKFAKTEVTVSNYRDTRNIKSIRLGTVALKSAFMSTLSRSILKSKSSENDEAYEYQQRLFSINKTQCDKLNEREKISHKDIDMQLTAEIYGYHKNAQGKIKKYKTWKKERNDNHYLDCIVICYALAIMDNVASLKEPKKEEKSEVIMNIKSIF